MAQNSPKNSFLDFDFDPKFLLKLGRFQWQILSTWQQFSSKEFSGKNEIFRQARKIFGGGNQFHRKRSKT